MLVAVGVAVDVAMAVGVAAVSRLIVAQERGNSGRIRSGGIAVASSALLLAVEFSPLLDVEWSYAIGRSTSLAECARLLNHIHSQTSKSIREPDFVHN